MAGHGRETIVRWNYDEWQVIADKALMLQVDHPDYTLKELVNEAQKMLPKDRQKDNLQNAAFASDVWKAAWARAKAKARRASAATQNSTAHDAVAEEELAQEPRPRPLPPAALPPSRGLSLIDIISTQIASAVRVAMTQVLTDPGVTEALKLALLDAMTTPTAPQTKKDAAEHSPFPH